MVSKIVCSISDPPIGALAIVEIIKSQVQIPIEWGKESVVYFGNNGLSCVTNCDLLRALARKSNATFNLYGNNEPASRTQIDHWLTFSTTMSNDLKSSIEYLNKRLIPLTYLVSNNLTIADLAVFSEIYMNIDLIKKNGMPINVQRWYDLIMSMPETIKILQELPDDAKRSDKSIVGIEKTGRKKEGKFVDLPGAEMGKVVVRFPPEASGYLHIGHAKAALLNQYYQQAFNGTLIMRFDDTNPDKENLHFEQVILEDLKMLQIFPNLFTHTSQYFDLMLDYCVELIKAGKAYADDTDPEKMKQEREQRVESVNRSNTIEKNLKMWEEMKKGSPIGQKCCIRAKIDMKSPNGCLRDPTIYRCKNEPHPRTGTKYKVYPTYDFACPIVDAIENVTHTLRTMEYHDRDEQFYWFIDALKLRKPYIWEYSRLNMTNTVLSKRKLTWFVEQGYVDGWDDPRMPTVRGILRRGMTVEGLKQFIIAQGSSKSVVFMEWDKIWSFNKKVIDPIAPRYTVLEANPVLVKVSGAKLERVSVAAHPKNQSVGNKDIWLSPEILIDYVDAETLIEGQNTTFINWGNLMIKKIHRTNGLIDFVEAELNLEDKDFKKTTKLTWLAKTSSIDFPPTFCVEFDHIISKPVLGKDEDFKQYINKNTRIEKRMIGDPELKKCKVGDIIQLQRRGFYIVDNAYKSASENSGLETPVVLFAIPDGHMKDTTVINKVTKTTATDQPKQSNKVTVSVEKLNAEISNQGDLIRKLKTSKAPKLEIDEAVKILLNLKAEFKAATGYEWKPVDCLQTNKNTSTTDLIDLDNAITIQGDLIRDLKAKKSPKAAIDEHVKKLLALKENYKKVSGKNWEPKPLSTVQKVQPSALNEAEFYDKVSEQGEKVRRLKSEKAEKSVVETEVKLLLELKAKFKKEFGKDYIQQIAKNKMEQPSNGDEKTILNDITLQGDLIRKLKIEKAEKTIVQKEVNILLDLKNQYKTLTGKDWTPTQLQVNKEKVSSDEDELARKITNQGNLVRDLKAKKVSKDEIDIAVKELLSLKDQYKKTTGKEISNNQRGQKNDNKAKKESVKQASKKTVEKVTEAVSGTKKITRLGLEARKEESLPDWYSQVITKGEMIEYYDVSGCYILRPWSFAIWKSIRTWFDAEITRLGVKEAYFPLFVSKAALEREKAHIADFAPEVAWVTKSGESDLAEPIAVRPTSETVMYPAYAKWIQSYRDLPIRLNQWNNVVRWEFKHPQPFLRTREFLWQEGHTAFATAEEAAEEVLQILDLYRSVYEDLLAIPVVKGRKTEKEKFAGGDYTTTVEAFVSASGRGIQGATSHYLGQNFSKMFEIVFEDPETQAKQYVFQNSWGITTRTIGVMIMVHADNQGLVLPPRVACIQVILVPCGITANTSEEERKRHQNNCKEVENSLKEADIRVEGDYRDNYSPGWKYNHWELKGVPIRLELGPKDVQANQVIAVRRDNGEKIIIPRKEVATRVKELLEVIHKTMFDRAYQELQDHTKITKIWSDFTKHLDSKNLLLSPFCGKIECEDLIKADSTREETDETAGPAMGAKALCIPFKQPATLEKNEKCIHPKCTEKPQYYTLFGRSY